MNKIMKISATVEKIFAILAFIPLPLAFILWTFTQFSERTIFGIPIDAGGLSFPGMSYSASMMGDITGSLRFAGFLAYLPLMGLQTYWLWQIKRLFGCYAQGKIFTADNTVFIRRTAIAFLATSLVSIVVSSIVGLILTINNPVGHRVLGISIGTPQMTDVLTGLVLVVIAWIMDEGRRLKEEADFTV
jgi:hypothetical protein